jgi:hypothetical protein
MLLAKRAIDRDRRPGRFLLTGSANLLLMRQVSESLAGRASYLTLWPMTRREQQHEYLLLAKGMRILVERTMRVVPRSNAAGLSGYARVLSQNWRGTELEHEHRPVQSREGSQESSEIAHEDHITCF